MVLVERLVEEMRALADSAQVRPLNFPALRERVARRRRRQIAVVGAAGSAIVLTGLLVLAGSTDLLGAQDTLQPAAPTAAPTAPEPVPDRPTPAPLSPSPMEPPVTLTADPSPPPPAPSAPAPPPPTTPALTPPAAPPPSDPGAGLRGRQFTAFERTRAGQPEPFLDGTTLEVQFAPAQEGSMRWRAGCNDAGTDVDITPDRLLLGPIASSARGCDEARERQDDQIGAFFAGNPAWLLTDGELVLTSGDVVIRLRQTR